MPHGGDFLVVQRENHRLSYAHDVATGDTTTLAGALACKNAQYQVYVQRVVFSVTTDAAQSLTFQDSAGTPVPIAKSKASPGLGILIWDFGPNGTPLTAGKNLDIVISAAGLAGRIQVEGYQKYLSGDNANSLSSAN